MAKQNMTPQEALKVIDKVHDYPCPYGIGGTAWMYIRNCIEKRIPKKPEHEDGPWSLCPHCGNRVCNDSYEAVNHITSYCERCGQALDWSES